MVIKVVGIRGNLDEQNRKRDKERLTKVNGGDFLYFRYCVILCLYYASWVQLALPFSIITV